MEGGEAEGGRETIPPSLWVEDKMGKGPGAGSGKQETAKPTGACSHTPFPLFFLLSKVCSQGLGGGGSCSPF